MMVSNQHLRSRRSLFALRCMGESQKVASDMLLAPSIAFDSLGFLPFAARDDDGLVMMEPLLLVGSNLPCLDSIIYSIQDVTTGVLSELWSGLTLEGVLVALMCGSISFVVTSLIRF